MTPPPRRPRKPRGARSPIWFIPAAFFYGGALAWHFAAFFADSGLREHPTLWMLGFGVMCTVFGFMEDGDLFHRNVQAMLDNLLVIWVSAFVGIGLALVVGISSP